MKIRKLKKTQPRFAVVRRGYDIESVEAYVSLEHERAERAGLEQKERIRLLKSRCEELSAELAVYRDKEEQIKTALMSATDKAEKTVLDVKFRYAMELERLKLFRAKWVNAYEEIKERYHFSKDALNMESVAVSTKLELEKFLSQDFSLDRGDPVEETEAEFKSEADRLCESDSKAAELKEKLMQAAEKKDREEKLIERKRVADGKFALDDNDVKAQPAAALAQEYEGFSLEEAQHPKESLAEICRYLGLGR